MKLHQKENSPIRYWAVPITENEREWIELIRAASNSADPLLDPTSREWLSAHLASPTADGPEK